MRQHIDRGGPSRLARPQLGVTGDGHDPHRDRHVVAGQAGRIPLAVPPLVGVSERVAHRLGHAEAVRQAGTNLAVLRQAALGATGVGEHPGHGGDATARRQVLTDVADGVAHHLARLAVQRRRHDRVEGDVVAAGHVGRLRRVGCAPDESQQRHEVDARPGIGLQIEALRCRQRQPAGAQSMLQWLTRPQVGRQGQRHRQLRHPSRSGTVGHPPTLPAGAQVIVRTNRAEYESPGSTSGAVPSPSALVAAAIGSRAANRRPAGTHTWA